MANIPVNGAFTSGSVSAAHGVNGILEALLAFVCGTDVEDEALAGSAGSYSGTLANTPIGMGRAVLKYTLAGTAYEVTDDGLGAFSEDTDDTITASSIDYDTGAYSITFDGSPTSVVIDYIYGEDGQDWSLKFKRNTTNNTKVGTPGEPFGSNCQECILHNTGLSGQEDVYIGFREWEYPVGNSYGIDLNGYLTYEDSNMYWNNSYQLHGRDSYSSIWGRFAHPMLPLVNAAMNYWFYSNRQRIIIIVKVQSNYESAYLGFCYRNHAPNEYPYPLLIKGSLSNNVSFSDISIGHLFIIGNPTYSYPTYMGVLPDNTFFSGNLQHSAISLYPLYVWTNTGTLAKIPSTEEYFTSPIPAIYRDGSQRLNLWDMDGVLAVFGTLLQSEDIVKNYDTMQKMRIFQNIHRTTQIDFMGIVEENFTTTTTSSSTTTTTS